MIFLKLFYKFFSTGLFSVGGGLATLPFLQRMADETGWFTRAQLADMLAVSESTPGPIGVNMATYVGFTTGGIQWGIPGSILGALTATLGLVAPSIIVILIIAGMLNKFGESKLVKSAFYGLRPASVALIASAGLSVALEVFVKPGILEAKWDIGKLLGYFDYRAIILAVILLVLTRYVKFTKKLHPICFIALSAVVGVVFRFAGA